VTLRSYAVTVRGADGAERVIRVPSKTDVQAGDAAVTQMAPSESIIEIRETDDPPEAMDAPPAGTQTHPEAAVRAEGADAGASDARAWGEPVLTRVTPPLQDR
jgi:hypothetical protein